MKNKITLFLLFLLFIFFSSFSCNGKDNGQLEVKNPFMEAVKKIDSGLNIVQARGKKLYNQYCVICHGEEGRGDGFNAFNLNPRPADMNEVCKKRGDGYIIRVITDGTKAVGKSSLCPPYGRTIRKEDINAIIAYIESKLCNE